MTGMAGCRQIRQALGVYVLGAIDPAERAQVDEHLAICPECREELASLAGLPALLRKVPLVEAERLAASTASDLDGMPSEELLRSLVARTTNVRRIHKWRGLAAAAAVALVAVAGGAAGTSALDSPSHSAAVAWHQAHGTGPVPGAHLAVKYRQVRGGTQMDVSVTGLPPGSICDFQVVDSSGATSAVGSWVLWQGASWYPASTWMDLKDLRVFQVTVNGKVVASARAL